MIRVGRIAAALAILGVGAFGCGRRSAAPVPVSGTVTLAGKPLPADATAFISFQPAGAAGGSVSAPIQSGSFHCPRTPSGPVTVFFEITRPLGPPRKSDRTGEMVQETTSLVPARLATGLQLTIEGPTTHDFDLTD